METNKKRSDCPLSCSLDVFGDKWSLLIIRDLMFFKKNTYNDFLRSAEGIATNILASRLKGLEENRHAAMVALICGSPKIVVP